MSESETWSKVRRCMQASLKLPDDFSLGLDATAASVPGWTSMAHLELILAIEREFGVMFEADEMGNLASAAAIVAALERARV